MTEQYKLFFVPRFKGRVLFNVPMSSYTTLGVGGGADVMAFPKDEADLADLLVFAATKKFPVFILGRGANLLVRDGGIRGIVVNMNEGLRDIEWSADGLRAVCGAGVQLSELSRESAGRGLSGAEFAADIPGTVGGAVVMNAGAYGGEMKDIVEGVEVLNRKGRKAFIARGELGFSYRKAELPEDSVIVRVHFGFKKDEREAIEQKISEIRKRRRDKGQVRQPSAGSVFKNPAEGPAGLFIEEAGLKGHRIGEAQISAAHANYIVNLGGATARDVLGLMALARDRVYSAKGIVLEPEIKVVGED